MEGIGDLFPRFASPLLDEALTDSPVVLIHGPRQCGKSTMAQRVGKPLGYTYLTMDDDPSRLAALSDPVGFIANLPDKVILDEIQRVPDLFPTIKSTVDRNRTPGRFILTGSTNILLLPKLSESLAGRMSILRLHPLSQGEIRSQKSDFLTALFSADFPWARTDRLEGDLIQMIVSGGYPAALARKSPGRRSTWYADYVQTLIQADVRELTRIVGVEIIGRLLSAASIQTASLYSLAELAAPFALSRPTIQSYVQLLARMFLIDFLPAWHSNRLKRLLKTPKLHAGDTGWACSLLAMDAKALVKDRVILGKLTETFVVQELKRQASWADQPPKFFHFRDKDGQEVDIVLEQGARQVAGVEVKLSSSVGRGDFSGLARLRQTVGKAFVSGVVFYDGEETLSFGDRLFAVPFRRLWEAR